jgi:hypothetical protein
MPAETGSASPMNKTTGNTLNTTVQSLVWILIYSCVSILIFGSYTYISAAEDRCAEVYKTLEQNTMRLKEYTTALQNAHRDKDFQLITVLNNQIDETLKQVRVGEAELLNCPSSSGVSGPGISSVKSQDTKFAEASCEELKKKYIQLSRKFNSLARRQQSVLSELSPEQKAEYKETEDSLRAVELELKKRCSPPPAPKPFQRKPQQPVNRNLR